MGAQIEAVFTTNNSTTLNINVPAGLEDPAIVVFVTSCVRNSTPPTTDILLDGISMNALGVGLGGIIYGGYELDVSSGNKVVSIVNAGAPDVTIRIVAYVVSSVNPSVSQPGQSFTGDTTITPSKNDCFYALAAAGPFGTGSSTPIPLNSPVGAVARDSYFFYDGGGWSQSRQDSYLNPDASDFDFDYDIATFTFIVEFIRSPEYAIMTAPIKSQIFSNKALMTVDITDDQGHTITERGIVYSTSPNPTTADTKVIVTGTTGEFDAQMEGLDENETYYVRGYAISTGEGTGYGPEISFETESEQAYLNGVSVI